MTFSVLEHLDKLEPTKTKNKYHCPVCNGNNLSIEPNTGKYQCWNGCELKDIREALSPAKKPDGGDRYVSAPTMASKLYMPKAFYSHETFASILSLNALGQSVFHYGGDIRVTRIEATATQKKRFTWERKVNGQWQIGLDGVKVSCWAFDLAIRQPGNVLIGLEGEGKTFTAMKCGLPAFSFNHASDDEFKRLMYEAKSHGKDYLFLIADTGKSGTAQAEKRAAIARECDIIVAVMSSSELHPSMPENNGDFVDWVKLTDGNIDYYEATKEHLYRVMGAIEAEKRIAATSDNKKSSKDKLDAADLAQIIAEDNRNSLGFDYQFDSWMKYLGSHWAPIKEVSVKASIKKQIEAITGKQCDSKLCSLVTETVKLDLTWELAILSDMEEWQKSLMLPFQNGVWEKGEFRSHNPIDRLTWVLPRDYDPLAQDWTAIDDFLRGATETEGDYWLITCFAAAALRGTKNSLNAYLHLLGDYGTGKGTIFNLISRLVGDKNCCTTTLSRLNNDRFEPTKLMGKRACFINDAPKYSGNADIFLSASTGETLPGEYKFGEAFQFRYRGIIFISSNDPVFYSSNQGAVRRRERVCMINKVPEQYDPGLEDKLAVCLPAWTNYLLEIPEEQIVETITKKSEQQVRNQMQIALETDALVAWMSECVKFASIDHYAPVCGAKARTKGETSYWQAESLYESYSLYCEATGKERKLGSQSFSVNFIRQAKSIFGQTHIRKGKKNIGAVMYGVILIHDPNDSTFSLEDNDHNDGLLRIGDSLLQKVTGSDDSENARNAFIEPKGDGCDETPLHLNTICTFSPSVPLNRENDIPTRVSSESSVTPSPLLDTQGFEVVTPLVTEPSLNRHPSPIAETHLSDLLPQVVTEPVRGTYIGTQHWTHTGDHAVVVGRSGNELTIKFVGRTTTYKCPISDFVPDTK